MQARCAEETFWTTVQIRLTGSVYIIVEGWEESTFEALDLKTVVVSAGTAVFVSLQCV